jgi:hypothetical protein
MADIGYTDYEYDSRDCCGNHDTPDSPCEATARVGDTEESYSNAALDNDSAGGIEELSNEEELSGDQFTEANLQSKSARLPTLVPCIISLGFSAAASWPDPKKQQTIHKLHVTVKSSCDSISMFLPALGERESFCTLTRPRNINQSSKPKVFLDIRTTARAMNVSQLSASSTTAA